MKTPTGKNPFDYLFVLRPALMPPVWTIFLLGAAFRAESLPQPVTRGTVIAFIGLFWVFGAVYLLNQYYDIESDRINQKLHIMPLGLVSKPAALYMYVVLNLGAIAAALAVSLRLVLLMLVVIALGIAYSSPPLRWKGRPYLALIANSVAHGSIVFLFGWLLKGGAWGEGLVNSLPYFFAVGSIYLLTTVPDVEGDRAVGKKTLSVVLGPKRSARWALGWYWGAVLLAFYNYDLLFVLAAIPLAYVFVRAAGGDSARAQTAVRWAVGLLSVMACIYAPWYAGVLLVGFFGTRIYYRRRFDIAYP